MISRLVHLKVVHRLYGKQRPSRSVFCVPQGIWLVNFGIRRLAAGGSGGAVHRNKIAADDEAVRVIAPQDGIAGLKELAAASDDRDHVLRCVPHDLERLRVVGVHLEDICHVVDDLRSVVALEADLVAFRELVEVIEDGRAVPGDVTGENGVAAGRRDGPRSRTRRRRSRCMAPPGRAFRPSRTWRRARSRPAYR